MISQTFMRSPPMREFRQDDTLSEADIAPVSSSRLLSPLVTAFGAISILFGHLMWLMTQKHLEVVWTGYYFDVFVMSRSVISIWGSFPLIEATGVTPGSRFARPSYFGIADYKACGRSEMLQGYQQIFFDTFPIHRRSNMYPNVMIIMCHVPIPCG